MIKFEGVGGSAVWTAGKLVGPAPLTTVVDGLVRDRTQVGFDYWASVEASLDSPWEAYLTVGSAWVSVYNDRPRVLFPPENPDGYSPEGPVDATMETR